jgi:hypothetical protein
MDGLLHRIREKSLPLMIMDVIRDLFVQGRLVSDEKNFPFHDFGFH